MRTLIESTLVSLDGVTEAPERRVGFDGEDTALSLEELGSDDAFVMGRVTYEKFYANWGHIACSPYIDPISAMPKYVASRSLTQTAWNATLLGPDPSSAIAAPRPPVRPVPSCARVEVLLSPPSWTFFGSQVPSVIATAEPKGQWSAMWIASRLIRRAWMWQMTLVSRARCPAG